MPEAALLFVREDRSLAERLARALELHGISICASASAYEDLQAYDGVISVFSAAAIRSELLMEATLSGEAQGKLIPVLAGLCSLPSPLDRLAFYDLCDWNGDPDSAGVIAIRSQLRRTARSKATGASLKAEMRGTSSPDPPRRAASTRSEPRADPASASWVWSPPPDPGAAAKPDTVENGSARRPAPHIPPQRPPAEGSQTGRPRRPDTITDLGDPFVLRDARSPEPHPASTPTARSDDEAPRDRKPAFSAEDWAFDVLTATALAASAVALLAAAHQPQIFAALPIPGR